MVYIMQILALCDFFLFIIPANAELNLAADDQRWVVRSYIYFVTFT